MISTLEEKPKKEKLSLKESLISLIFIRANKQVWNYLPFFLMHLLASAYAEISPAELVRIGARSRFKNITNIMKKINVLTEMGIDLHRAIEITMKKVRLPYFRGFLQRFAQVAKLGEDVVAFMNKEYNTFMTIYTSELERSNIRLRRFTEAYGAVLSSSVLIIVVIIFIGMIWGGSFMVGSTVLATIGIFISFSMIFYVRSPLVNIISRNEKKEELFTLIKLDKLIIRITILSSGAILATMIIKIIPYNLGPLIQSIIGIPALVIGYIGRREIKKIEEIDERFPDLMTMLSTTLSTIGSSLLFSIKDICRLNFGKLSIYIKRMAARLELGISKDTCWSYFKKETSSELVRLHVDAFAEANSYGSPTKLYGPLISNSSIFMLNLRKRVEETTAFMKGIVVPMHPILCIIIGMVMGLLNIFMNFFKNMPYGIFNIVISSDIYLYSHIIIFVLSIINAFIIYEVSGEQEFNFSFYLGLFIVIGWICYYLSLTIVASFLSSIGFSNIRPMI
ncbi:MAG: hypothetical protein NZ922_06300 [Candidatus Methanomethyliaceae archaeon]|nr:hypothetical protein [Candidatus Methanomethyliaceae archaeon]MDW7971290.1 hypothetical protein [Nitrososphaerota archaeon]